MLPASNTKQCFREFTGQRLVGVLLGELYPGHGGNLHATLIFEDGRGLAFYSSGAYYVTTAREIRKAVEFRQEELRKVQEDLKGTVDLMGALPDEDE